MSLYGGKFEQSNITPGDVGREGGNILVPGPHDGQRKVYLQGPEVMSLHDSIVKIGRILHKDVELRALGP